MRIILTGGGTAGHVLPHFPVVEALKKKNRPLTILYIGSAAGPERRMVKKWGWKYESIPVGKFRRYFDFKNFSDPFKIMLGIWKAFRILGQFRPHVVFSKGGYVSMPVMVAARLRKVPIVIHDSDAIPGLTTRLAARWVQTICLGYSDAKKYFPKAIQPKIVVTGIPIRTEILKGNRAKGFQFTGLNSKKSVILVMGGSLGSQWINRTVENALPELLKFTQVIHIVGSQSKGDNAAGGRTRGFKFGAYLKWNWSNRSGYAIFEYVDQQLPHLYAIADAVVSRAGANTLAELLALNKPMLLIPLGSSVSHGDQQANAKILEKQGKALVIEDQKLNASVLIQNIKKLLSTSKKHRISAKSGLLDRKAALKIAHLLRML